MSIEAWIVTTANWLCQCGAFCESQYAGLKKNRVTCAGCEQHYEVTWNGPVWVSVSEVEKGGGLQITPDHN